MKLVLPEAASYQITFLFKKRTAKKTVMQNKKIRKRWPKRAIQTFMIGLAALS